MSDDDPRGYAVLARKHRPQTFEHLIGQEALVRVLTNAFAQNRIPHAMILTGVRGVGKTTTARIIAKGLNCAAADGPTITPCGVCDNCVAISESRHVDVLEMDAASRTGIDDIREIIDAVRYRSNVGRYKVYIIDEVHMLSKNAFNGLLKTLEEPPPHVKFILATTDIHKVPVTVLSRCMRFDLRRVDGDRMVSHLAALSEAEGFEVDAEALALIARASEGSVRDALSLLDQAVAHGAGHVDGDGVRAMLGLSGAFRVFELFEAVLTGDVRSALETLAALHGDGADPEGLLREVASACHLTTLAKAAPTRLDDPTLAPAERAMAMDLAAKTSMRALGRAWQMLLKAIEETATAPSPLAAAEMAVVRMTYVSELPSPEQALKRLREGASTPSSSGPGPAASSAAAGPPRQDGPPTAGMRTIGATALSAAEPQSAAHRLHTPNAPHAEAEAEAKAGPARRCAPEPATGPRDFSEIVALIRAKRDGRLLVDVERFIRPGPVSMLRQGRDSVFAFAFTPTSDAPADIGQRLTAWLSTQTGRRWAPVVSEEHQGETLAETRSRETAADNAQALAHPLVKAAFQTFPGARLTSVRPMGGAPTQIDDDEALLTRYDGGGDPGHDGFGPGDWTPDPYVDLDDEDDAE